MAALGGMALPALLYLLFNHGSGSVRGWGIPMATDIAFSLGVLSLLGDRIPSRVRVFLLTLATVDDIGAILVIAAFYTAHLSVTALLAAIFVFGVLLTMRQGGIRNVGLYVLVGGLFWVAVLRSGVHATIAGVILGMLTPARPWFHRAAFGSTAEGLLRRFKEAHQQGDAEQGDALLGQLEILTEGTEAPLDRIERQVRPWVSYLVLPVFAFANAGVVLSAHLLRTALSDRVTLGVLLGLLIGKLAGILGFAWMSVRLGLAELSEEMTWSHLAGVGLLAGIGFTVSLFITDLAFAEPAAIAAAKLGILAASVFAGLLGYLYLRRTPAPADPTPPGTASQDAITNKR